jgi:capsular polysaccharide biosynthesis protein
MDVAQILAMGRRWWWLLILGVLFSIAAYGVSTRVRGDQTQPTYGASTTLFVTLPELPSSAFTADAAKQPWELDRLMATYAQMARSRRVAERAIRDGGLTSSPADLASRISTDTFGYTQLLGITVQASSPIEAQRSVTAIVRAFADVRAEQSIPGDASVFESSAPVRTDRPTPLIVDLAIVVLAGVMASGGVVFAFERLRPLGATSDELSGGGMCAPAANERAL